MVGIGKYGDDRQCLFKSAPGTEMAQKVGTELVKVSVVKLKYQWTRCIASIMVFCDRANGR